MSFRNHFAAITVGGFALAVSLSAAERVQAQATAPAPSPVLYVNAVGGRFNRTRTEAMNPATPYDTITHACQNAQPNDTIEVAPGTYTDAANVSFKSNLTIRPQTGTMPVLKGSSSNDFAIAKIDGSDHILFTGFEVDGTGAGPDAGGVVIVPRTNANTNVTLPSHDIQVKSCKIHDAGGGGILSNSDSTYTIGNDYIQITGNEIYHCLATGKYRGSGISLHEDRNLNFSDTGYHSVIQNNNIHDNVNVNTDIDPKTGTIDLFKHTDGNGIIIDTTQDGARNGPKILVQNNLVYRNGGRGIHVFLSSNVTVLNNTVYQNDLDPYLGGGGELTVVSASNVLFFNNIAQGNGIAPAFVVSKVKGNDVLYFNSNILFKNNTYTGASTNAAGYIDAPSTINSDPSWGSLFVNPAANDFHLRVLATRSGLTSLQSQSALNRGSSTSGEFSSNAIDGTARTPASGGSVDRGAYEQSGGMTVTRGGYRYQRSNGHVFQAVTLTAVGGNVEGPISLVLDNLTGATLIGPAGVTTSSALPAGSPYVNTTGLLSDTSASVVLEFTAQPVSYTARIVFGSAAR